MNLPFWLENKDWREIPSKDSENLGQDPSLDQKQKEFLAVFRKMEDRVEWSCRVAVVNRNWLVILTLLFLAINGPQIVGLINNYFASK